ncbi:MAG: carbohydrate kinase family protein [Chloroflexi bacterium]|nr:carbohydrate kinase family protein [Chloroflexota bacterium]
MMSNVLVSGLINIETTLRIEGFPLQYNPVNYPFFGINSSVSGVGYNVAKAMTKLGDGVTFVSVIGRDVAATQVRQALAADHIPDGYVLPDVTQTAQSVILYDRDGRRQIHVDLKDIQEHHYPAEVFRRVAQGCDLLVLCNINFSRPFLGLGREAGKLIATDVHAISSLEDDYNRDFMQAAHILFMSDERLPDAPEVWAEEVNEAARKAVVFASYKIGALSAADGFLDADALDRLYDENGAAL